MKSPKESSRFPLASNEHSSQDQVRQVLHSNETPLRHVTFVEKEVILLEIVSKQREVIERMPTMLMMTMEEMTLHSWQRKPPPCWT